jgi:hypothetical protein
MDPTAVTADHDANNNQSIAMVFYLLFFFGSRRVDLVFLAVGWCTLQKDLCHLAFFTGCRVYTTSL